MKAKEQREHERIFISFPLHCTILPKRIKKFDTLTKDFGLGGVQFFSSYFMPQGEHLKIRTHLASLITEFNARVVWCVKKPHADGYYIGIRFLDLSPIDRNHLTHFINSK